LFMVFYKHIFKLVVRWRMHVVNKWSSCSVLGVICHLKKSRNVYNFICMNFANLSNF
jgi:hypothetical protein